MADLPSQQTEDSQDTADLPSQQREDSQDMAENAEIAEAKALPQIYFLTSGRPDGGASEILSKIDEFDKGRNFPVHTITLNNATADPETKKFGKDLASKTGGFFRSIEQS